ncbi:related to LAG1 - longevity-assurance protein [Melanopsichium pennsylvanicum]|uniref:Related to LAG1 - longevity-assurance protein n=2 Tax=Melanopsichium pennsylvanicum TaxID=63383 RepID=A0AAJ4XQH6_9BASI|nr:related to LAG1-longevity-assurance protein [Melanopsichium pennsylvanicum 4]SNX86066.1 related to LAG1 - longevity-assurance protein [Melanopsichium pennsylvanicum]
MAKACSRSRSSASSAAQRPSKGYTPKPTRSRDWSATRRVAEASLSTQIQYTFNGLIALLVMHTLSSPSSLNLAHLSSHLHLPSSLHSIIPSWLRLPLLSQFASDLPNASEKGAYPSWSNLVGESNLGPFRSDARGFGHPLTALHNFTRACLGLSYPVPDPTISPIAALKHQAQHPFPPTSAVSSTRPWALLSGVPGYLYERGSKDALFVCTLVLLFTLFRAVWMKYILLPLGELAVPHPNKSRKNAANFDDRAKALRTRQKEVLRFAEQGFSLTYYACSWSLGLYIASQQSYWPLNTVEYWSNYPELRLDPLFKFYYLASCAFYIQQLFVLHVEARRSDHWQMFSHHVITIALIYGSYVSSYHRVGNAILCLMDPGDIALNIAKMLKYAGWQSMCDVAFGLFMVTWLVTRHILYMRVLWSCIHDLVRFISFQPTEHVTGNCFTKTAYRMLVVLLIALQVILLMWFYMICRVAYRVVTKNGAVDSRSDAESSHEDDDLQEVEAAHRASAEKNATNAVVKKKNKRK